MFTHINLIISQRHEAPSDLIRDLTAAVNERIGRFTTMTFVRGIYEGQSGHEYFGRLVVVGLRSEHVDVLRNAITFALNETFIEDDRFLYYSFGQHDRVLAAR